QASAGTHLDAFAQARRAVFHQRARVLSARRPDHLSHAALAYRGANFGESMVVAGGVVRTRSFLRSQFFAAAILERQAGSRVRAYKRAVFAAGCVGCRSRHVERLCCFRPWETLLISNN